jgi:hypothetical protein
MDSEVPEAEGDEEGWVAEVGGVGAGGTLTTMFILILVLLLAIVAML